MKSLIFIIGLILVSNFVFCQDRYCFGYAYNNDTKTLYVSNVKSTAKYKNCSIVISCIKDNFLESLKIEAGSKANEMKVEIRTQKDKDPYGNGCIYGTENDCFFNTSEEANEALRKVLATYREKDFTVYKVSF